MPQPDTVHEEFLRKVVALQLWSARAALADLLQVQPGWAPPEEGWTGNVLDIAGLTVPFKRDGLNRDYVDGLMQDPVMSTGEAASLKLQLDYSAAVERAYRTRHASTLRCQLHAAARRQGHGMEQGALDAAVVLAQSFNERGRAAE